MKTNILKHIASAKIVWGVGFFLFFLFAAGAGALSVHAASPDNEIHYGGVDSAHGDTIEIGYRTPSGDLQYSCSLETNTCEEGTSAKNPEGQDAIGAAAFERVSDNGQYGLKAFALRTGAGISVFYSLYDISGTTPQFKELIPFFEPAVKKEFTRDGENIIFIEATNKAIRYNISSGNMTSISLPGTDLPFFRISPDGRYMSSYNYVANGHNIYSFVTKETNTVPAKSPSYLEFGTDGWGAYKDDAGNFDALYTIDLSEENSTGMSHIKSNKITSGESVIKDYIFVGGHLFYMGNAGHPLRYSIHEFDSTTGEMADVASDVSYGEYMKVQDGKLLYQKLDGKNANIFSYDPETGETHEFEPVGASPLPDGVKRQPMVMDSGRHAVLLSPKEETGSGNNNLFIWLHGGPMRQVAIGYHSYLSYGVYDELLNKLADSGAYVLKLDYTGSSGYGEDLLNGLHGSVGVADVSDVTSAVKEMTKQRDIDHVYLIGNSYGGYLSLKTLVDHPSLFAGAIAISPVTDWYGLINRIPSSPFKALFNGTPNLSNLSDYMDASIYKGIPELSDSKKILLEYGEKDTEVPTWQSTDFIAFANKFDIDLDTLVFSDEGHIIRKRDNLDALCKRIVEDFDLDNVSCGL